MKVTDAKNSVLSRARGALFGQIIGDNLGSVVEFESAEHIRLRYPDGVRELTGGAQYYNTILEPGQPTDDSELALALARSLVRHGGFDIEDVAESYRRWARSDPFDIGGTCANALLRGMRDPESQSNGSLMRVSPIGVAFSPADAARYAELDAEVTHIDPYPIAVNSIYAAALSAVIEGADPKEALLDHAGELRAQVEEFMASPPGVVSGRDMGWVRYAFHLTCYFAARTTDFEEDLVAVIGYGGDTDTNGAIAGAFLGAVHGFEGIPQRWRDVVGAYEGGSAGRPKEYAPFDLLELADALTEIRESNG